MTKRQRRWALSGGIGSGKSEVRSILRGIGIRTVDADSVGHEVLAGPGLSEVAKRWPGVVRKGEIDRKALAEIVFGDFGALAELEAITHPMIFGRIEAELEGFDGVAVVEVPLISDFEDWSRMVVDAPDAKRFKRCVDQGMEPRDVSRRMASQPTRSEWLASADLLVPNQGSIYELRSTVLRLIPLLSPS